MLPNVETHPYAFVNRAVMMKLLSNILQTVNSNSDRFWLQISILNAKMIINKPFRGYDTSKTLLRYKTNVPLSDINLV